MKKISLYKSFIYLILLNSFVSITNELYPANLNLGKIVGVMLIFVIGLIYIKTLKKNDVLFLIFILLFNMLTIFRIEDASIDLENIIFFTSTTMMIWKFSEVSIRKIFKKEFEEISNKVFVITNILLGIVIFSSILSNSWKVVNGIKIFLGLCDSGHKLAGNLCFFYKHQDDTDSFRFLGLYVQT